MEIIYGIACGVYDIKTKKIPNILHLLLILYMIYQYRFIGVFYTIIICIILSPLFFLGFVGSADIKMVACITGYCGPANSCTILIISLILAGIYSLIKMIISGSAYKVRDIFCAGDSYSKGDIWVKILLY